MPAARQTAARRAKSSEPGYPKDRRVLVLRGGRAAQVHVGDVDGGMSALWTTDRRAGSPTRWAESAGAERELG